MTTPITSNSPIKVQYISEDWFTEEPPPHRFCVKNLLPIGAVTLMIAHGGMGKSLLAIKMALHIVQNFRILGAETNGRKVAYMSLEDSIDCIKERIYKIAKNIPALRHEEVTSKMMIIDRYGHQTHIVTSGSDGVEISDITDEIINLLKKHDIKCLFVDTFVRSHGLNENDNAQMSTLLVAYEKIAQEADCAVVLLHHLPKGAVNKAYSARGASAITDNARSSILLELVDKKDINKFSDDDTRRAISENRLVRVFHTKHNYSAQHPEQYFEKTADGSIIEISPTAELRSNFAQRYDELYAWWENKFERRPLTKTNIDESVPEIRPERTNYGKETYRKTLDEAIAKSLAELTTTPEGGSRNSKATYYILRKIE